MKKVLLTLLFVIVLALVIGVYFLMNPTDSFYRSEFNRSTGITLPTSAKLVAGCSNFYVTEAIYQLDDQNWDKFISKIKVTGKSGKIFEEMECIPSIKPELNTFDTSSVVSIGVDQFSWKVNKSEYEFYWKIEVD